MYDITFHAAKWNGNQKVSNAPGLSQWGAGAGQHRDSLHHERKTRRSPEPGPIMLRTT